MVQKRKRFLTVITVIVMLVSLLGQAGAVAAAPTDAYEQMIERWSDQLTGGSLFDATETDVRAAIDKLTLNALALWGTMNKTPTRTTLWAGLEGTTNPAQITSSYGNLKTMTLAYKVKGSSLQGNESLKADIISALDWLYANRYNATIVEYGNWWEWEIGTPLQLNDIVTLLYYDLTPAQISNYIGAIEHLVPNLNFQNSLYTSTGANRVWMSKVVGISGTLGKNPGRVAMASAGLTPVFQYVTSGDGFYADGSFVQHSYYAYTGGYGVSLLQDLTDVLYFFKGSPYENTDSAISNIYKWVYDAYEPLIYKGAIMDMTRGREIARSYTQDHLSGHRAISGIIRLSQMAGPEDAIRLKAMVKAWINSDTSFSYYKDVGISALIAAKEIMNDSSVTPRSELITSKVYAGMDRAVHLRPGFGFGVSMSSSRIANYESINNENLKGWYTGEGMTYLYNNDLAQYTDYWPTVNKYRLPGTTVDTMARADGSGTSYRSSKSWTGGSELLGLYSAAGMDLKAYGNTLAAKKSWFMLDDEVVALGAGINSTDGRTIETTIENRMLNKPTNIKGIDLASPPSVPLDSEPLRLKVNGVSDSGNDGNGPQNTFDNNLTTRWSASGDGQWLKYDLGKVQPIGYAAINFWSQNVRYTPFDILVSTDNTVWSMVYSGQSSIISDTSALQEFDLTDSTARYIKLVGHGNSVSAWNSIAEVQFYAPSASGNLLIPPTTTPLTMNAGIDSQGATVSAASDGNISTYWSASADGQSLKYDLGSSVSVGYVGLSFNRGNERQYSFDIQASTDNNTWNTVYAGQSAGLTQEITAFDLTDTQARYWKVIAHGNNVDATSAISEIQFYAPNTLGAVLSPLHNSQIFKGDEALVVNGTAKSTSLGWSETMNAVSSVYLEGTGGYYFPQPTTVKALRETRTGSWSQVDSAAGSNAVITKNFATLWFDHGSNPTNASYSYVVLPNKNAQQTSDYASNPDIQIIKNNATVQAVKEVNSGVTGANFWAAGAVGAIKSYQASSLMLKEQSGVLDISVSDPTQLNNKITFEIGKQGTSIISKDAEVSIIQTSPTIKFEVNSTNSAGKSYRIKLQYDASVPDVTMQGGLQQLTLQAATPLVEAGKTVPLTLTGTTEDGGVANLANATITYTSSKTAVAAVTSTGVGTASAAGIVPGKTVVTATVSLDGVMKSATLTLEVPVGPVVTTDWLPTDDSFVRDGNDVNTNFGTSQDMVVSNAFTGYIRIGLMKFDLSSITGKVVSAILSVKARTSDSGVHLGASKENKVYPVAVDTWNESTVTWNNKPAASSTAVASATIAYNSDPNNAVWPWYSVDISTYIAQEQSGDKKASMAIAQEGGGIFTNIASKESANKPHLSVVSYQPATVANDVYAPSATVISGGVQGDNTIALAWSASQDNLDETVTYVLYRNGVFRSDVSGLIFTDTGLSPSTIYTYTVKAKDAAGNLSAVSNPVTVTTGAGSDFTRYEAENAILTDVTVATAKTGYSGTGYILDSSFTTNGDKIKFTINRATAGAYPLKIRYSATDLKPNHLIVNGGSAVLINFTNTSGNWMTLDLGNINLVAGSNTIEISKFYGWINLDYIEVGGSDGTTTPPTVPLIIGAELSGPGNVLASQEFKTTYSLTNVAGSVYGNVYAQQISLSFDTNLVEYVSAAPIKTGVSLLTNTDTLGVVRLVAVSPGSASAITSDGAVLELVWRAKAVTANQAANIAVTKVKLSDGLGRETDANGSAYTVSITNVNKTALLAKISQAQAVHDASSEGGGRGQYPIGSRALLLAAIQAAQLVAANGVATQQMTDDTVIALGNALQAFQSKLVTSIKGDVVNNDGLITIGDLGFVAAHYGIISSDSDWNMIKAADMDDDGRIGVVDLARIAQKVLE